MYCDTKFPPSVGWKTISPGFGPTAGCGHDPPPARVESVIAATKETESQNVCEIVPPTSTVEQNYGSSVACSRFVTVVGAGCEHANGIYIFEAEFNRRPYFRHVNDHFKFALWYFGTCPLNTSTNGLISYNGWYISLDVGTSSYAANSDMYCCYSASLSPPLTNWIVREPGIGPLSGCGQNPVPTVRPSTAIEIENLFPASKRICGCHHNSFDEPRQATQVMLVSVMLPDGNSLTIPTCEWDLVQDLMVYVDSKYPTLRIYDMTLTIGDIAVNKLSKVFHIVKTGDILMIHRRKVPISLLTADTKRVVIIGAGPVGNFFFLN